MKEDEVLAGVRDHVRAERADDVALEAIARGEAGSEVAAELERRAASDADAAALVAASRPLGDDVVSLIAAKVGPKPSAEKASAEKASAEKPGAAKVTPFRRRAVMIAGPVALAACMLFYFGVREPALTGVLLPDYSVVASSQKEMRGAAEARPSLELRGGPDAEFEILARPATTTGKVVAFAFAIGDGEPNPVEAKVEIAPEGAVRIRGRGRALDGAREVRVVVGTATDSIKRYEDALSRARSGKSDAKVRVLVVPITRP